MTMLSVLLLGLLTLKLSSGLGSGQDVASIKTDQGTHDQGTVPHDDRSAKTTDCGLSHSGIQGDSGTPAKKKSRKNPSLIAPPESANQSPMQSAPSTQYCPGGICANGSISGSPQVNNYRNPVPNVVVLDSGPTEALPWEPPQLGRSGQQPSHRGAEVTIPVDKVFYNPAFVADCNVPCKFPAVVNKGIGVATSNNIGVQILDTSSHVSAGVARSEQMYPGVPVTLVFESLDDRALTLSNVRPYSK
jgi:hypothetical protein